MLCSGKCSGLTYFYKKNNEFLYTENKSGVAAITLLITVTQQGWVGAITRQVPMLLVYGQTICKAHVIFKTDF